MIQYISEENSPTGLFWCKFHASPTGHGGPDTWTCGGNCIRAWCGRAVFFSALIGTNEIQFPYISHLFFLWLKEEKTEITYLCNVWPIAAPHWYNFLSRVTKYIFTWNLVLLLSRKMKETQEENLKTMWILRLHDRNSLSCIYPHNSLLLSEWRFFRPLLINQPFTISAHFQWVVVT